MTTDGLSLGSLVWSHFWQIAALAVVVGLVAWPVGRRWPHLGYALWLVVLVKCLFPPVLPLPTALWDRAANEAAKFFVAQRDSAVTDVATNAHVLSAQDGAAGHPSTPSATSSTTSQSSGAKLVAWNVLLPGVWLVGGALLAGTAVGRLSERQRVLRKSAAPANDTINTLARRMANQMGIRRDVAVWIVASDVGPAAVGLLRPRVYVPRILADRLSAPQLETMLAHELVHVRRGDAWIALVQFVAQVLWWFHPAVWWMNRQLVRYRERACDEEVVATLEGRRAIYARCLVDVLATKKSLVPLGGYPGVRPVELTRRRLEEIMTRTNMTHRRAPAWSWLVALLVAVVVLPTAGSLSSDAPQGQAMAQPRSAAEPPSVLKYGDGKADGKKSYGGSGHMIRFELPEGVTKVRGLKIHGSRYGLPRPPDEDFEITLLSDDMEESLHAEGVPYRLFRRGREMWVRVLFEEPVELPPKFWVALNFNAHQTKGVYVSYDTSTKGQYSRVGLVGDEEVQETDFGGDWMVQVLLQKPDAPR